MQVRYYKNRKKTRLELYCVCAPSCSDIKACSSLDHGCTEQPKTLLHLLERKNPKNCHVTTLESCFGRLVLSNEPSFGRMTNLQYSTRVFRLYPHLTADSYWWMSVEHAETVPEATHLTHYKIHSSASPFAPLTSLLVQARTKQKTTRRRSVMLAAASSAVAAPIAASRSSGANTTQCISGRNTTRSNATFSGRTGQNAEVAGFHAAAPLSARGSGALSRCVRAPHHADERSPSAIRCTLGRACDDDDDDGGVGPAIPLVSHGFVTSSA